MSIEPKSNHCRILVFEEVLKFFKKSHNPATNIKSTGELISQLENVGLRCVISCPRFFILSPLLWRLLLKYRVSENDFVELTKRAGRKAVIHFLSASQLYDIEEFWTHYVCEFFSDQYTYFDPYLKQLSIDYPYKKGYAVPSSLELHSQKSLRVLVY